MKKLSSVCMVLVLVIACITPVSANTRIQSPIRDILGVDYTIQSVEYTSTAWGGIIRWQFLELEQPLNLRNFPAFTEYGLPDFFGSERGDAFIVTWPEGLQTIMVDLGEGQLHRAWITNPILLNPQETVTLQESINYSLRVAKPCFERFGMYHQYTTSNFYFRSNKANYKWLPDLAAGVEKEWDRLMEVFNVPSQRLIVYLFDIDDLVEAAYFWAELEEIVARYGYYTFPGNAYWMDHYIAVVAGPRGRTDICKMLINLAVHEIIHVFQRDITSWNELPGNWIHEGFAGFMDGRMDIIPWYRPYLGDMVRQNRLFTLDNLESPEFLAGVSGLSESVKNTSIFMFITDTFGMDAALALHRYPNDFEGIFGISRAEFERQWHRYLRIAFGDPSAFFPDATLLGTWDRLGTVQSLDTFTQRNQRNANNWARDILTRRGNRHQRLTFNDNGRVTATGVTGFGNRWTDGSIGGRGYEIRTIGGNDFLFINNQGFAAPHTGAGGPWTVFIRR